VADRNTILDALRDAEINGLNDIADTTLFKIRKPQANTATHPSVAIRIEAADQIRIRIFEVRASAVNTWPVRIGPNVAAEYTLPNARSPWAFDFRIEALTLPGDPGLPGPAGTASPNKPDPFLANLPRNSTGLPIYTSRLPGDSWIEIVNPAPGSSATAPRDVALFTIAPFLLLSNLQQPKKVYVADIPDQQIQFNPPPQSRDFIEGNVCFVADLEEITTAAGITLVKIPLTGSGELALDGHGVPIQDYLHHKIYRGDPWVQDEFEVGYSFAPHGWMHIVLHCRRNRDSGILCAQVWRNPQSASIQESTL